MNCHSIRAAIETASRHEPVGEGVRRHLAGCHGCRAYADELSALLALLNSPPRVTAPADFEFRLRARILAAQAERQSPFSFLKGFWALPFSLGQAATTMAAVAILAALTTFYFVRHQPAEKTGEMAAVATPQPQVTTTPQPAGDRMPEVQPPAPLHNPSGLAPVVNGPKRMRNAAPSQPVRMETPAPEIARSEIAKANPSAPIGTPIVIMNRLGTPRIVRIPDVTYGAEPVVARLDSKPAPTKMIF
jgi:hypothetical protein